MEYNDILSTSLIKKINKIEKQEAKINEEKKKALEEIKKEFTKDTFIEVTDIIINSDKIYSEQQNLVEQIRKKEEMMQCLEYDDYMAVFKIYSNII